MADLVTTNIRIPGEDYLKYKKLAEKQGKSFAHLVRYALETTFTNLKVKKKKRMSLWDIDKYAVRVKSYDPDESIDKVVYTSHLHGYKK